MMDKIIMNKEKSSGIYSGFNNKWAKYELNYQDNQHPFQGQIQVLSTHVKLLADLPKYHNQKKLNKRYAAE